MAGITLEVAEAQLALWIAADSAVSSSQSYEIDTGNGRRKLTRADAAVITDKINFWQAKVNALTSARSSRGRTRYLVNE